MKTVKIAGKKYPVQIIKGTRYINGMIIDDFMKTLNSEESKQAAIVGKEYIDSKGEKSPQIMFNELHQSKNN